MDGTGRLEIAGDGRGLVVIALVGEFDVSNVGALSDCLASLVIAGQRSVTVDLARTNFIDSASIGVLVTAQIAGLKVTVRGAFGRVRKALDIVCAWDVMNIETVPP